MKNFGFISMIIGIVLFICVTIGGIVYTIVSERPTTEVVVLTDTIQTDTIM